MFLKYKTLKKVFPNLAFTSYVSELKKIFKDCNTVLDLGCGAWSPVSFLDWEYSLGVDACSDSLFEAKQKSTHTEFRQMDIKNIVQTFSKDKFDCCVALDFIEHFTKQDGLKIIEDMEKVAKKLIVISTPNGEVLPFKGRDSSLEDHLSSWSVNELKELGFKVVGIYGDKSLRGPSHSLKFKPKILWGLISEMTHFCYARYLFPQRAAALLCYKPVTR